MSLYDHRTKPETAWTYYVVEHLPKMDHIHRFDTPEEAIRCYRDLDPRLRSAIGSSIGGVHEMDLIHRCANDTSVLVTAADHIETPLWRESTEIQNAIDLMIAELNVQHERNNTMFPSFPSVLVELQRYQDHSLDSYFCQKILLPDEPGQFASAITEAFVMGEGWMKRDDFFRFLRNSTSGERGSDPKDVFLDRLNIRYINLQTGYSGEADISPQEYALLKERTAHLLSQEMLDADMDMLLSAYLENKPLSENQSQLQSLHAGNGTMDSRTLSNYRNIVKHISADTAASASIHEAARNLQHRLLTQTPREFRKSALKSKIAAARTNVSSPNPSAPSREEVR